MLIDQTKYTNITDLNKRFEAGWIIQEIIHLSTNNKSLYILVKDRQINDNNEGTKQ